MSIAKYELNLANFGKERVNITLWIWSDKSRKNLQSLRKIR